MPMRYPEAPTSSHVDDHHGVKVADPYRPLEDPHSPETKAWIEAENRLTESFLAKTKRRAHYAARMRELIDHPWIGIPHYQGGHLVYPHNTGRQNQDVLYVREGGTGADKVLIDPNAMSADGTVALGVWKISPNGRHFAYACASAGSDWNEIKVRDVSTLDDLSDKLEHVKFSGIAWDKEGRGFYYSRYPEPKADTKYEDANYHQKLYYHELGTPQSADVLVYERPDQKDWGFSASVTCDGRYLVNQVWKGTDPRNLIFLRELDGKSPIGGPVRELINEFKATYVFIGSKGSELYFRTTEDADRGKVIAIDVSREKVETRTIIPETDETLQTASYVRGRFLLHYLKDARSVLRVYDGQSFFDIPLPEVGCVVGFVGEQDAPAIFYGFQSMTRPQTIFRYEVESGEVAKYWEPELAFDPDAFETRQVFYESKDGTSIPLFIAYKKGLTPTGDTPTILYGYGGFGLPVQPWFRFTRLPWLELGGIYAQACLRGGGEYGEEWHQAGTRERKQNVFDDFIAGAEYLIKAGYTNPKRLAISGGSNGGLLVAACMVQRPDLFGAVLPAVGVLDMLRFHKFTIGWAWKSDYGDPEHPENFKFIYAYSPLHNLKKGVSYPATLITTADHDDRVVPAHSFKFAAALQAAQGGEAPILIRIETKAGHGAGKPIDKIISEQADVYAFLSEVLGAP